MSGERPSLRGVLETALYHGPGEADRVRGFYEDVLGLRPVAQWPAGAAFRIGAGVCLVFERDRTAEQSVPHGATGPVHACFVAAAGEYEDWKRRLGAAGVELIDESTWGEKSLRSVYFHDPAGNLLEIAEADIWPD